MMNLSKEGEGGSCLKARPGARCLGSQRPDIVQGASGGRVFDMLRRRISPAKCVFAEQLQDAAPDDVLGTLVVFHGRVRVRAPRGALVVGARLERVMCKKRRLH